MGTYTFVVQYKGGIYIEQIKSNTLLRAFRQWGEIFSYSEYISEEGGLIIRETIKDSYTRPYSIDEILNVWFWSCLISRDKLILHIIKTVVRTNKLNLLGTLE